MALVAYTLELALNIHLEAISSRQDPVLHTIIMLQYVPLHSSPTTSKAIAYLVAIDLNSVAFVTLISFPIHLITCIP
jgi:hypothetical protein